MKIVRFIFCALLMALVGIAGCTFKPAADPLVGWKLVGTVGFKTGEMHADIEAIPNHKAISDDVQNFVNNLPVEHVPDYAGGGTRRYCYWLEYPIELFENGTGQHAVSFQMEFGGLGLKYVLFYYDKSDVRTQVVKTKWHYQS
jgi:hypothetical protein